MLTLTLTQFFFFAKCIDQPGTEKDKYDAHQHDSHCRYGDLQEVVRPDLEVGHGVLLLVVDQFVSVGYPQVVFIQDNFCCLNDH